MGSREGGEEVVSFPITFGFEKVVKARVDPVGEINFQLFEP
jgi:hypothetical protein